MTLWWLSFCDEEKPEGSRLLGVSLVEGEDFLPAVLNAHRLGCNPGGQVLGLPFPEAKAALVGASWKNRLLSRAEAEAVDKILQALEVS